MFVPTLYRKPFKKVVVGMALCVLLAAGCKSPFDNSITGGGVAKTVNGGADWVFQNTAEPTVDAKGKKVQPASILNSTSVTKLEFAPHSSSKLFAATLNQGLFYSENSTDTWKQILSKFSVYDFVVDSASEDHIYVAGQATGSARVLESKDHGKSWEEIYNDAVSQNSARALAVNPANAQQLILGLNSGDVLASTDGGRTWSLMQNFQSSIQQFVWTSGLLLVVTREKGVYLSRDNGKTVQNITRNLLDITEWRKSATVSSDDPTKVANLDLPADSVHIFYRVVLTNQNPSVLYVAGDAGLFATTDFGTTWRFIKLPLRQTENIAVRTVALGDNNNQLYTGVANTVYKSTNNGQSWQVAAIATGTVINYILVDPGAPSVAYIGFTGVKY